MNERKMRLKKEAQLGLQAIVFVLLMTAFIIFGKVEYRDKDENLVGSELSLYEKYNAQVLLVQN